MTPEQKIKHAILKSVFEGNDKALPDVTKDNVNDLWDGSEEEPGYWDARYEFREGEVETNVPSESSRHYETKSVAAIMPDGTWVGWTYWHGGGKHGNPEEIEWMEDAYDLTVTEEEKVVTVRTFTKAD
jgi:hypothetical protein